MFRKRMNEEWFPSKKHLEKFCNRTTDGRSLLNRNYKNNECIRWNYKLASLQKKNLKEKNFTRFWFKGKDRNVKQLALLWFSQCEINIEENDDYDGFSDVSSINGSIQSECDENEFKPQITIEEMKNEFKPQFITEKMKNVKNGYTFVNNCGRRVCVNPYHIDIIKRKIKNKNTKY